MEDFKKQNFDLRAENERLKKMLSQPSERTQDPYSLVQQVAALVDDRNRFREQVAKLEDKAFQLNQDKARLEKNAAANIKLIDELTARGEEQRSTIENLVQGQDGRIAELEARVNQLLQQNDELVTQMTLYKEKLQTVTGAAER